MHHKHILAICLIISAVLFVVIAIGMVTPFSNIAVICGMVLVFLMTCGFFYATLHLSKFSIASESQKTEDTPKTDAAKPAADDDTAKPAADDDTEKPAADDDTEKPAADDDTEKPAADAAA